MPAPAGHVPMVATLNAGWTFFRANAAAIAPFAIGLAILSTLVWMQAPMPGGSPPPAGVQVLFPLWALMAPILSSVMRASGLAVLDPLVVFLLVGAVAILSVGYWTLLLRRALGGARATAFGEDWARQARVFASIWFLVLIVSMAALIVLSSVLSMAMSAAGVSNEEILAARDNQAAIMDLFNRTMRSNAGMIVWVGLIGVGAGFAWLMARLCLAGPATIAEGKASTFQTWSRTKGDGFRIAGVYALLAAPALLLTAAPFALLRSDADLVSGEVVFVLQVINTLVQTWVIMPMMAGAGAFLYKGLRSA